jgi:hypothetical protein
MTSNLANQTERMVVTRVCLEGVDRPEIRDAVVGAEGL